MEYFMSGSRSMRLFGVMSMIGLIVGIIAAFALFFGFMTKKNEKRFQGIFMRAYDFLHFKKFIIEGILKFFYVLCACICTFIGVFQILSLVGFLPGVLTMIFGNLIIRIIYELLLIVVLVCKNISGINQKMDRLISLEEDCCPNCGAGYDDETIFCGECGTKLRDDSAAEEAEGTKAE